MADLDDTLMMQDPIASKSGRGLFSLTPADPISGSSACATSDY
jgi:hypothetical protein